MVQFWIILFLLTSCSTAGTTNTENLDGVWEWKDINNIQSPILKTHRLIFMKDKYNEVFFENGQSKGLQEGELFLSKIGNKIEFSLTANIQTIYKGKLFEDRLMIISTNGIKISPPALYIRK